MRRSTERARRCPAAAALLLLACLFVGGTSASTAVAGSYQRISGEGSSWAANAIDAMRVNVKKFGITVDYNPSGSTAGRKNFLNGTVDFAASEIPFQFKPEDGSAPENPAPGSYAYMPVVAGGTAFMYNLKINGKQVTNLRLSGANVAKIFTGAITSWDDPAIVADNPGLTMPTRAIVPVVRSDGSGSTAQFTSWMISQHSDVWTDYCNRSGRAPACGETSFYPIISGMISQAGDLGIAGYVSQGFAEGAIGYVNYSYALGTQFPVAKVLNSAGFYTEPTPQNVAVSLLKAQINTDESNPAVYLTQQLEGVYTDADPRNYPLSSYSYLILPTKVIGQFNEDKGLTLGAFSYYAMCEAQQTSASLGYSPMPINLVQAGFDQIRKIPGVVVQDIDIAQCKNPTFAADGSNLLADTAPQPKACDQQGALQCADGTGGLSNVPTAVLASATTPAAGGSTPTVGATAPAAGGGSATGATTPASGGSTPTVGATAPAAGGGAATGVTPVAAGGTGGAATGVTPVAAGSTGGAATGVTAPAGASATGVTTPAGSGAAAVDPGVVGVTPDAAGAAPPGPSVGAVSPTGCDADTGLCAGGTPTAVGGVATIGAVTTTTLSQSSGWGVSVVLLLLVAILTVGLVIIPALAWRHLSTAGSSLR